MAQLWPWLAIAGAGALHGLSPATGWMLAAACGVHARDEAQARRALGPIAFGQLASMSALAWAVSQGLAIDRGLACRSQLPQSGDGQHAKQQEPAEPGSSHATRGSNVHAAGTRAPPAARERQDARALQRQAPGRSPVVTE